MRLFELLMSISVRCTLKYITEDIIIIMIRATATTTYLSLSFSSIIPLPAISSRKNFVFKNKPETPYNALYHALLRQNSEMVNIL